MTDQEPKIPTVALIDVAGIFRAAFAVQPDHTAVDKTLARVRSLRSQYDHCAVCVDSPPYRRAQLSPIYKGHREAIGQVGRELYAKTKQAIADDGIAVLGAEGYEADDVIATLVTQLTTPIDGKLKRLVSAVVISADKDMAQLVNDAKRVTMLDWSNDVLLDAAGVRAVFGVDPPKVRDMIALMGDTSDNIPGVRNVGRKIAALVVNSEPGLNGALAGERIPNLSNSYVDKIADARETVILGRKLVTLEADAPVSCEEIFIKREPKAPSNVIDAEFEEAKPRPEPAQAQTTPGPRKVDASQSLMVRPSDWSLQLEPCSTGDAWATAQRIHNSRIFQKQFGSAEAIFTIMLRGRSIGLDAVTSLSSFYLLDGKACMHASLIVGLVLKSRKAEYFELEKSTETEAIWMTKRVGGRRDVEMSFTVRDALNAGLLEGTPDNARGVSRSGKPSNWDTWRRAMLRWRAATELARAVYPDVVNGLYTPDEISDGTHDPEIEAKYAAA